MQRCRALVVVLVVAAGCGNGAGSRLATDGRGTAVVVTGVLTAAGTMCPIADIACVDGIRLEGSLGAAAAGDQVVASGWFDGARLLLQAPPGPADIPTAALTLPVLCPGLSNPPGSANEALLTQAMQLVGSDSSGPEDIGSPSMASMWWNESSQVETFWFAHDMERYRSDLQALFGDRKVCIVDGATYSEAELMAAQKRLGELVQQGMFHPEGGYGTDHGANRVVVPLEAVDPTGRRELNQLPAVVAVPFIELVDRPLAQLPVYQSAVIGNVDVLTAGARGAGGMAALWTGTLHYDVSGNCLYAGEDGERTTIEWPFGYTAVAKDGVVTVHDAGGAQVAATDQTLELGGGGVAAADLWNVVGDNYCGATTVWVVAD